MLPTSLDLQFFQSKSFIFVYLAILSLILAGSLESMLRVCLQKMKIIEDIGFKHCDTREDDLPQSRLVRPKAKGWHRPLPVILIKELHIEC